MTRPQLALGLLLVGSIGIEMLILPGRSTLRTTDTRPATAAIHSVTDQPLDWLAIGLRRPLFSPDRRPVAGGGDAGPSGLPRLSGIIVSPAGRRAMFVWPHQPSIVAGEGARVGGYRIEAILDNRVTITGADGAHVLQPRFATGNETPATGSVVGHRWQSRPASIVIPHSFPLPPMQPAEAPP